MRAILRFATPPSQSEFSALTSVLLHFPTSPIVIFPASLNDWALCLLERAACVFDFSKNMAFFVTACNIFDKTLWYSCVCTIWNYQHCFSTMYLAQVAFIVYRLNVLKSQRSVATSSPLVVRCYDFWWCTNGSVVDLNVKQYSIKIGLLTGKISAKKICRVYFCLRIDHVMHLDQHNYIM